MFVWEAGGKKLSIREAASSADYRAIEEIQREAWGFSDLDIVPAATLIATQHAGGVVLGAFEADRMIGFAYGFPALDAGRPSLHSHMLAVRHTWRNAQAGYYLKLAQRRAALDRGITEITWTFDPLQSLNAHLNFNKLGVIARRYLVNFYGEETSSPLHQGFGTDRLWVSWQLNSDRVRARTGEAPAPAEPSYASPEAIGAPLLVRRDGDLPVPAPPMRPLDEGRYLLEIPHDITSLKERDPAAARRWREATREAFLLALESDLTVADLLRVRSATASRWFYLLAR